MHPNTDVWNEKDSKIFTLWMSSPLKSGQLFLCNKLTAPALTSRKLPFHFWSLPSFISFPLQCKASKSEQCLWSLSCGHVYPKPGCEPVKMKEPTTWRTHHTISPSVNKEASCDLSYLGPSFTPETQRVIDHHVQHPPCSAPALSAAAN